MNGKLNKILPLAGLFCGSLFGTLFADNYSDSQTDSTQPAPTEITPPAGFAAEEGIGFSLYGDFVYLESRSTNLGFAATAIDISGSTTLDPGTIYYPTFKYKPGFRVGVDFDLGHDNWDLDANYTWLNGSGSKNIIQQTFATSTLVNLFQVFNTNLDAEELVEADGVYSLHYNLINLDTGRHYFISEFLTLRPSFGISGAWDTQRENVHYTFLDNSDDGYFSSLAFKQSYWGVGFNTGLETGWHFDENWSLYGNFSYLNLWSKYRVQSSETDYTVASDVVDYDTGTISLSTQGVQYGFQNVLGLDLGVRWATRFDDDTMGAALQIGWEQQVWINHTQFGRKASNLSIQGLAARARFDF